MLNVLFDNTYIVIPYYINKYYSMSIISISLGIIQ